MKRIVLLFVSFLIIIPCFAQGDDYGWRSKYNNIAFNNSVMSQDGIPDLLSNYGVSYSVGRTFYLHSPIAGFLRFGIDATWLDLSYTSYKIKHITHSQTNIYQYHHGEVAMQVGPSLSMQFLGWMNLHGYFRYAPSYSLLYADDAFYGNYATFFTGGASLSLGAIGFGFEARWGECDYDVLYIKDNADVTNNRKIGYNGWRAYLTFKF